MKYFLSAVIFSLVSVAIHAQGPKLPDGSALAKGLIAEHQLGVRDFPSQGGRIIWQIKSTDAIAVTPFTYIPDMAKGQTGYWLSIRSTKDSGWVFWRAPIGGEPVQPTRLKVIDSSEDSNGRSLIIRDKDDDYSPNIYASASERPGQSFFTLSVGDAQGYDNSVLGTYIWRPDTNELRHLTDQYRCDLTDDLQYAMDSQLLHQSPDPISVIQVWKLPNQKLVFSGNYVESAHASGHLIDICFVVGVHDPIFCEQVPDASTVSTAAAFARDHAMPKQVEGQNSVVVVSYRLDLDAGTRHLIGCEWVQLEVSGRH